MGDNGEVLHDLVTAVKVLLHRMEYSEQYRRPERHIRGHFVGEL